MTLYGNNDPAKWTEACRMYGSVIETLSKKKPELTALDQWILCELSHAIKGRSVAKVTKAELSKIMKWKLMKGKFRPNLQNFIDGLSEDEVEKASLAAFAFAENGKLRQAIDALSALKGVGPATATAVLAAYDPSIPFMSDEAIEQVIGSPKYTVPQALQLAESLRKQADALNAAEAGRGLPASASAGGSSTAASSSIAAAGSASGSRSSHVPHKERTEGRTLDTGIAEDRQTLIEMETAGVSNDGTVPDTGYPEGDLITSAKAIVHPIWTANRCQLAIWASVNAQKIGSGALSPASSAGAEDRTACAGAPAQSSSSSAASSSPSAAVGGQPVQASSSAGPGAGAGRKPGKKSPRVRGESDVTGQAELQTSPKKMPRGAGPRLS